MKFYKRDYFIILMLILFFPVGVFLMWKFKYEWSLVKKSSITIFVVLVFVFAVDNIDFTKFTSNNIPDEKMTDFYLTNDASNSVSNNSVGSDSDNDTTTEEYATFPSDIYTTESEGNKPAINTDSSKNDHSVSSSNLNTTNTISTSTAQSSTTTTSSSHTNVESSDYTSVSTTISATESETTEIDFNKTVYIRKKGDKTYHYNFDCREGEYYPVTLLDAMERGYYPCKKCVLGK